MENTNSSSEVITGVTIIDGKIIEIEKVKLPLAKQLDIVGDLKSIILKVEIQQSENSILRSENEDLKNKIKRLEFENSGLRLASNSTYGASIHD